MQDRYKTKHQLIEELLSLRAQLELVEGGGEKAIRPEASQIIPPEHYAMIFDQFPLGISVIRNDGYFIYVNPAFVKLTGYTLADIDKEKKWFQKAYPDKEYRRMALYAWVKYQTQQLVTEKIFKVTCKNGKTKTIEYSLITVADGTVISILTDVNSLGEAEVLLKEREEQWRLLLDTMNEGFITVNESGVPVFVNQSFCTMTGYLQEEIVGRPFSSFLDDNNLRIFQSEFSQRPMGRFQPYELSLRCKDGNPVHLLMSPRPIYDSSGRFAGSFGTCMDITKRKEIEEALRESENKYRTIVENTNDAIYIHDFEGNIIDVNDNACLMVGYEREELVGANLAKVDADWRAPVNVDLDVLLVENRNVFDRENIRKDGSVIHVEVSVKVISREGKGVVNAFVRDISERKQAEIELRKRKERLKNLANNLPGVIYQFFVRRDGEMGFQYISDRSLDILGVDNKLPDLFERVAACVPEEDRPRFVESINRAAHTASKWEYEGRFITPAGEEKYVRGVSVPEERPGEVVFNGMVLDITEQKRTEVALRESRKKYQDLVESINEVVWELDATGRITYVSPNIEKLIGYDQHEIIGKLPYEFALFEEMEKIRRRFHESLGNRVSFAAVEGIIVHRRGAHIAVEASGSPFFAKENRFCGYRGIMRDISEIKKLRDEMIKSHKLESIGILAGGVAHDFNNLLMGIIGYIGLAKLNARQEMVVERSLSKAEESCLRAKELARRLLTFSRGGDPQMKPIDIREVVRESVKLVLSGSNIQCRYYLAKQLHTVKADEEQLRQAIGNIIINAMEASPAGGSISVKGENVHYRRKDERPFIKVTITDRGKGISKESLISIFDPYFTTKDMGAMKGTGLGLSISYSIIKKHGGDITVQSEVGKGTSVSVYLPAWSGITQSESTEKENPQVSGSPEASGKRILVMDDEELIRSFMKDTISFLGYEVTTCDEGLKAVEIYRKAMASQPYDLVVLDLTVPGGSGGQETIQRLLDVDPAVKAIICSGYTDDPVMSHYGAYGFKGALVKPTSIDQIKTTLSSILNK